MARIDRQALPAVNPPPQVLRAAMAARRGVERLHRSMTLPVVRVLEQTVELVDVQATAAFAELGVADVLARASMTAAEIAPAVGADADMLDRLLRYLATRGIVDRTGDRFTLTTESDLLRRDHPESIRDWVCFQGSAWQWHAWEHFTDGIRDGEVTPFARAHGRPFFDHVRAESEAGAQFDAAMRSTSRLQGHLLARALDLSGVRRLCDVGGGTGTLLATLVRRTRGLQGTLFDLPEVVDRAKDVLASEGVADRVDLVAGDMFEEVPAGADRYLLSAVVHDWPDETARTILENVRAAMGRDGRAIVVELELPDHDGASLERAYDLLMLVLGGGRERSRTEYEVLFALAGLAITGDTVLANGWHAYELSPA